MKRSISRWDVIVAGCLAGIAALTGPSQAAPVSFTVTSTGARQVPPVATKPLHRNSQFLTSRPQPKPQNRTYVTNQPSHPSPAGTHGGMAREDKRRTGAAAH